MVVFKSSLGESRRGGLTTFTNNRAPVEPSWRGALPVVELAPVVATLARVSGALAADGSMIGGCRSVAANRVARVAHIGETPATKMNLSRPIFSPSRITKGLAEARKMPFQKLGRRLSAGRQPQEPRWSVHDQRGRPGDAAGGGRDHHGGGGGHRGGPNGELGG